MQYMGMTAQNSLGLPQQQAAMAQGMAAGMMQQGIQPQNLQSMQAQGVPAQALQAQGLQHGDMMMQQHTHVQEPMGSALSIEPFPSHDLLDDAFPHFASPVIDTQSSSSQHQGDSGGVSQGMSVKSEGANNSAGSGPAKNASLQRNLRKLSVKGRTKSQGNTPDDMFSNAMQHAQMQMSMAMPVVGPGSWLSPSTLDTSQDGVRRPPAA